MELKSWVSQAKAHWKEFRPAMYEALRASGTLEQSLQEAATRTHEEMTQLEQSGFREHEAWEIVREKYLFPPEETSEPMEPSEFRALSSDLTALQSRVLRMMDGVDEEA